MTFTYLVSKNLRRLRVHFVVVATLLFIGIGAIHPHAASAATYSDTGTLSSGGTWGNTLTFTDPNVTATFDVTNTNYRASLSDSLYHCMQTDSCGWWGVDDKNGYNCWDSGSYVASDCDYQTSLNNSLAAFSPGSVNSTKGVMWNWHSSRCGPNNSVYPIPANPNINCQNVSTVTIQFSAPASIKTST